MSAPPSILNYPISSSFTTAAVRPAAEDGKSKRIYNPNSHKLVPVASNKEKCCTCGGGRMEHTVEIGITGAGIADNTSIDIAMEMDSLGGLHHSEAEVPAFS
jgi:hypothetical protein